MTPQRVTIKVWGYSERDGGFRWEVYNVNDLQNPLVYGIEETEENADIAANRWADSCNVQPVREYTRDI